MNLLKFIWNKTHNNTRRCRRCRRRRCQHRAQRKSKRFPIWRAYFPFEGIFPPFSVAYFPLFFFEGVFPPWLENVLEAEWIFSFWSCHFFSPSLDVWKEKVIFRVFKSKGSFIYFDGLHVINSRNKELPFYFIKASFLTLLLNRPRQDFEKEQLYTANKKWIPSCFSSTEYFQSNQPLMPGFFSAVFSFLLLDFCGIPSLLALWDSGPLPLSSWVTEAGVSGIGLSSVSAADRSRRRRRGGVCSVRDKENASNALNW